MGDEKSTIVMAGRESRDRELLIPVADSVHDDSSKPSSSSSPRHAGLGFITSLTFIFLIGVFMSSWLGASVLALGEWFIKRMPFVRHIYNASKQISSAISPDQKSQAFKEVAIIRHPRIGEYAFGFITSSVTLQSYSGDEELCCVYVPTNHLYIGDIFLINTKDVIRPNLSVREGIEIVVSGGMSMPQILSTVDTRLPLESRSDRS
ncbi:hypothetical protein Goklo_001778 [Gossypium klotzschianum]|uniref:Uncharacterized protein n=1 Tax=Gossypium klotzschianum TaxID=34286 RepID=A0A7J8W2L6_9ROSI|nr:hypothetical protein [Gossypium klotzschianum]